MMDLGGYEADDFVSLAWLCFEHGIEIGPMATAIEQGGVWGWDRYGRFVLNPPGSPAAQAALDRLARQYELDQSPFGADEDLDPTSDPLFFYGWLCKDLPDFAAPGRPRVAPRSATSHQTRLVNGLQTQIGALLEVALGQGPWRDAARFPSQSQLIEAMSDRYQGMQSMSKRSLESSFARGREAINEP